MEIKARFDHFNINVLDLQRSIAFYEKALDLKEHHRKEASDGSFILVYLADDQENFLLELTWLRDRQEAYELGDNESKSADKRFTISGCEAATSCFSLISSGMLYSSFFPVS